MFFEKRSRKDVGHLGTSERALNIVTSAYSYKSQFPYLDLSCLLRTVMNRSPQLLTKAPHRRCHLRTKRLRSRVQTTLVKMFQSPYNPYLRRMSAATVPVILLRQAREIARRAHPHQLHYTQPCRQPYAGRHNKTYTTLVAY